MLAVIAFVHAPRGANLHHDPEANEMKTVPACFRGLMGAEGSPEWEVARLRAKFSALQRQGFEECRHVD